MRQASVSVAALGITTSDGERRLVDDVSLEIAAGEILGLVGESGSGKTTLGLALLYHCRRGVRIGHGTVRVGGHDLGMIDGEAMRLLRGRAVAYVPQDPVSALNPTMRIAAQLSECLPPEQRGLPRLLELLQAVKLPASEAFLNAYPHQMSGGQLQRVAIAMAFANHPRLVVMDEPTTGLDVTTQSHVLATVRRLCAEYGVAALYVSHDIAVVASIARRVAVIYGGRIVEIGPVTEVLHRPAHPYTRALIRAVPDLDDDRDITGIGGSPPEPGALPGCCSFAPRCSLAEDMCTREVPILTRIGPDRDVRCFRTAAAEQDSRGARRLQDIPNERATVLRADRLAARYGSRTVLHDVTFDLRSGECIAIVGESGSAKTTLARCLAGLHGQAQGTLLLRERVLPLYAARRDSSFRRSIQYIFQNPYASFNPSRTIGDSLAAVIRQFSIAPRGEERRLTMEALDQVSLPASMVDRFPRELSGGQRQRAAIARALIADPEVLICDEITSALDVSVQAVIIGLLTRLQRERGLSMVFVTHNLAVARGIAHRILVMRSGRCVEFGAVVEVLEQPRSEETRRLLRDAPRFHSLAGSL